MKMVMWVGPKMVAWESLIKLKYVPAARVENVKQQSHIVIGFLKQDILCQCIVQVNEVFSGDRQKRSSVISN